MNEDIPDDLRDLLDEVLKEIQALRQDVRSILENMPMQMIPSDPSSEVQ
jgi:hypothetical protein